MANDSILVDTSCWIEYFNRPGTESAVAVEKFVREDRASLTGVVLVELLQGAKSEAELSRLRTALGAVDYIETSQETYLRAGNIGFALRRRGVTVPVTDCVIAAAAESSGGRILTLDAHFAGLAKVASLVVLHR
ncbi:MAG: type II toxin-antitoxin system VapC family toxin [Rubrobacteraceae bacterium]